MRNSNNSYLQFVPTPPVPLASYSYTSNSITILFNTFRHLRTTLQIPSIGPIAYSAADSRPSSPLGLTSLIASRHFFSFSLKVCISQQDVCRVDRIELCCCCCCTKEVTVLQYVLYNTTNESAHASTVPSSRRSTHSNNLENERKQTARRRASNRPTCWSNESVFVLVKRVRRIGVVIVRTYDTIGSKV